MSKKPIEKSSMWSSDRAGLIGILHEHNCLDKVFQSLPVRDQLRLIDTLEKSTVSKLWRQYLNIKQVQLDAAVDSGRAATLFRQCSSDICSLVFGSLDNKEQQKIFSTTKEQQKIFSEFAKFNYPKLKHFDIKGIYLHPELMNMIEQDKLPKLESLELQLPPTPMCQDEIRPRIEDTLQGLFQRLSSLKQISVRNLHGTEILAHLPGDMQKLWLFNCGVSSCRYAVELGCMLDMERLIAREKLTEIRLVGCKLSADSLDILSTKAANLEVLEISMMKVSINVEACKREKWALINFEALATFQSLKELHLNGIWDCQTPFSLQRQFLSKVSDFKFLESLRILHLRAFFPIEESDLEIEKLLCFKELRELSLERCNIPASKLEIVLRSGLEKLERLLLGNSLLIDGHLSAIGTNCPALTVLDISSPDFKKMLSNADVKNMIDLLFNSRHPANSRNLDIYACGRIEPVNETEAVSKYKKY